MKWSPQQDQALKEVSAWLRAGTPQVFRLFGYAGTGKTTLARHIAAGIDGDVAFAAFTGKAALVMRAKGCRNASTIHSLIYRLEDGTGATPQFTRNKNSPVGRAALTIIDECSMVDAELGRDLLSYGTPVLVLGDPAQLPPVKGGGFFTEAEPDVMLDEVHRQARDNPIIAMSMIVREGGRLEPGAYGESRVLRRAEIDATAVAAASQVLVGRNTTRRSYNARIRELYGFTTPGPQVGERLVCLRNRPTKGLLNGGLWRVEAVRGADPSGIRMRVEPEDAAGTAREVVVRPEFFAGTEETIPWPQRRETDEFDFGYALTVHKAQGSQWDKVVLFDESFAFREHRARWLYTGLTRAAEAIDVVV